MLDDLTTSDQRMLFAVMTLVHLAGGKEEMGGDIETLQNFHAELRCQPGLEARDVALAIELFTKGSLNTFAKPTNADISAHILYVYSVNKAASSALTDKNKSRKSWVAFQVKRL